jgi:hypothetical protein
MRYLLMLGWFREHMDRFGKKRKLEEGQLKEIVDLARHHLVDEAWKWLAVNKGVSRQDFINERAPMPLHVHAVFANVL